MMIEERINEALKGVVETYPDTADFEDEDNIKYPYAVFKLRRHGSKTKDGHYAGVFTLGIFLAAKAYNESVALEKRVREAILGLEDRETNVIFSDSTCDFDEDEAWVTEMNFEVKVFNV